MLLENITLGQLLHRTAERYPTRPAVVYKELELSYRQLDDLADRFALSLLRKGVRRGDHVGILCEAEPNTVIASYAIARIGGVVVMLNTSLGHRELNIRLAKANVRFLLIGDGYKNQYYPEICDGLVEETPCLEAIYSIGQTPCSEFPAIEPAGQGCDLTPVRHAQELVRPGDTAYILFTSGTGSSPKAVMSSHYSRVNSGIQQAKDLGATCQDRFCTAMPMFHCFCLSVNVFASCAVGACLYLPESRRTDALLKAIAKDRCTILSCVPTLFRAILNRHDLDSFDLTPLRIGFIGGSAYPDALFVETERRLGMTLLSSLGQTEATAGITTSLPWDPLEVRLATVGHFMEHVEGQIQDPETKQPLPLGTPGEICVRGYVVMQGYYGQPEATAKAIDENGWLHTGDIGFLDADGNVHLSGRMKEIIIRGGENISPKEIENIFFDDGHILSCRAVGVPDRHYGEETCLCVVTNPDNPCSESYIRSKLAASLAAYKVPKYILFLEELPTTATGKVRLQELKDIAVEKLQLH